MLAPFLVPWKMLVQASFVSLSIRLSFLLCLTGCTSLLLEVSSSSLITVKTVHTPTVGSFVSFFVFPVNNKLCALFKFLLQWLVIEFYMPAPWMAHFSFVNSSCWGIWLLLSFIVRASCDQLSTFGRQPLSSDAAKLAMLQGLNGFLLPFDVDLIPVNRVELLWIHMQQQ